MTAPSYATIDKVTVRPDNSGVDLDLTLHPCGKKTNARLGFAYEGAGFGLFVLPEVGDEVVVVFPYDDFNAGVVVARMPNKTDHLPAGVGHDKILLVGKAGHDLDVTINGDASIVVTGSTTVDSTGNATVKSAGNTNVEAGGTANVKAPSVVLGDGAGGELGLATADLVTWAFSHTHKNVQAGGDSSGAPNEAIPATGTTTVTKAN